MWLRQSTASQEILLGPFPDSTDGDTAETGLTIANTDIKLWKEGATTEANKNSGGGTHIASGRYYAVLDATDSNTLGKLEVNVHVAGALAVRREFMVVPANVYDSLVLGTDELTADVVQWLGAAVATPTTAGVPEVDPTHLGGSAQSLTDLKDFADAGYDPATNKVQGVVLVDATTTNTDMRGTDNALLAANINLTGGAVDTVTTLTNKTGFSLSTAGILAIWGQLTSALTTVGTIGKLLVDNINATISSRMAEASINTTGGAVDSVTTVSTTTTNTDMRGTDGANTTVPDAAGTAATPADVASALNTYDGPTNAEMEARTPSAAELAYIVSNAADGKPVTFTGGTTTTAILGNVDGVAASSTDDAYNGRILIFNVGTLDEQATDITDYDGATKTAIITAVTTAVTSSHTANLK